MPATSLDTILSLAFSLLNDLSGLLGMMAGIVVGSYILNILIQRWSDAEIL